MTPAPPEHEILPSPCVGICRLDNATGWWLGCARDTHELASWRAFSPVAQARVWADLPPLQDHSGPSVVAMVRRGPDGCAGRPCRKPKIGWYVGDFSLRSTSITSARIMGAAE